MTIFKLNKKKIRIRKKFNFVIKLLYDDKKLKKRKSEKTTLKNYLFKALNPIGTVLYLVPAALTTS